MRPSERACIIAGLSIALTAFGPASAQADSDWAPDRLMVQVKAGVPEAVLARVLAQHRAPIVDRIPQLNAYMLQVSPRRLRTVERALSHVPHFKCVGRTIGWDPV